MFADGQWQIVFPESKQAIGFFFPVLINIQVDLRRLAY